MPHAAALGQKTAKIAELYAELDATKAAEAMSKLG